ncbi:thioredoxin-like protein [Amylocystis lapponica]|nr:thioredoxin-like protein [Amylocystis lapponica]
MLVVHHLNDSRSQRVLWLLEELHVDYEIKKYQRTESHTAPPELKAVHPLGTAPVIVDGDITLAESGAIIQYLLDKYGQGRGQPPQSGKIDDLFFTHYAEGTLMPLIVNRFIFTILPERAPFFLRPLLQPLFAQLDGWALAPRFKRHAQFIEAHLAKADGWFAGGDSPTAADYMMQIALDFWAAGRAEELGEHTLVYIQRVHDRPAFQRAIEKGGKYSYA